MSTSPSLLTDAIPESTSEGIAFRRQLYEDMENADLATLGPCPPHLRQNIINILLSDGFISQTIVVYPAAPSPTKHPLVVYIHGGGFTYNTPSFALSPARAFASFFGAVVACPSYKLAPEHLFPAPVQSAWEAVAWLSDSANLNDGVLKGAGVQVDPALGFVLAGASAGGNMAAVITSIAAATQSGAEELTGLPAIEPRITGLFTAVPKLLHEEMVPSRYASAFTSREENANAPVLNAIGLRNSHLRLRPDVHSPWFSPINLDLSRVRDEHPGKVYVQCGNLDILRDDALIYEQILRDEDIAETRIDVFEGYDHAAWISLPFPQCHSQEMREKTLDGMAWLLGRDWDRSKPLPY